MYMAAAIRSMRFEVSEAINVENCIGSILASKPTSLPTALMMSTITP